MHIADRVAKLPPYVFAQLGRRIRQMVAAGKDVVRLDIGSPDLPPPDFITEAMFRSAQDASHHGYGGFYGIPALRQALATYYERRFGIVLDPDTQVAPLIGSKEGIANAAQAFVDPGDVVLVPDPGYPTYTLGTLLAGGVVHDLPLLAENRMLPDLKSIPKDVARAARILWLNYPNNPTGVTAPLSFFESAVSWATQKNMFRSPDNPSTDVV